MGVCSVSTEVEMLYKFHSDRKMQNNSPSLFLITFTLLLTSTSQPYENFYEIILLHPFTHLLQFT